MSIYEYDAEKHLRMEREDAMAEGIAKGKAEGIVEGMAKGKAEGIVEGMTKGKSTGRKELLVELIKKKLARNKSAEVIAEELEEDISTIKKIIEEISK